MEHQPNQYQQQQPGYPPQDTLTLPYPHRQFLPFAFPNHFLNPSYPIAPPSHSHLLYDHHPMSSSKRPREAPADSFSYAAAAGDDVPSPKRTKGQDVVFRIVVPSKQIGKVIGKGGHRIQNVRDQTTASIKIADAVARFEERIIIISSKDNDDGVTNAEKALHAITNLILQDDGTSSMTQNVGVGPDHVATNAIRLLIAGSQAGSLIGMSGQNIEKLRDSSGASVTILAPNQVPFCASAHESDRLVQVSGEVTAVLKAVEDIGSKLREFPPKQVISMSPASNYGTMTAVQQYLDPTAAECVTMDMSISYAMVGGLIGRSGSNISRIRNESGAVIKVQGARGKQLHRHILLSGTPQQVALAKQRIDEYVYSQLVAQSGIQPPLYDGGIYGAGGALS